MSPPQIFISIARMHHISNPTKFRRLKRFAVQSSVSGFVKTGKPGVLVIHGPKDSIKTFLEHARGLRYLDFHHLDTKFLINGQKRLTLGDHYGLQEVDDLKELVAWMDRIGEKEWFREQMGMSKGGT